MSDSPETLEHHSEEKEKCPICEEEYSKKQEHDNWKKGISPMLPKNSYICLRERVEFLEVYIHE